MQRIKLGFTAHVSNFISGVFSAVIPLVFVAAAQAQPTNLAVSEFTHLIRCVGLWLFYDVIVTPMSTEANKGEKYVVPKFQDAGWDNNSHSIAGQCFVTDVAGR